MAESIVLHVGTHKTGSTSLQHFLYDHRDTLLASHGIDYPPGLVIPASHAELPLLAIRSGRMWPARLRFPETQDPRWLAAAAAHVREVLTNARQPVSVLSHEDLSYVRYDDELADLRSVLGDRPARVVVFLRDPERFLTSYRAQLVATGFPVSDDPTSFAYVERGSWLVDHASLLAAYRSAFGPENVEVIDYEEVVQRDGSVIPTFAALLGIQRSSLPVLDGYFLNRSGLQLRPDEAQVTAIRRRLAEQAR
jgi:hypothetical protein